MASKKSGFLILKALGDETRYNIVTSLLGGERCACELPKMVKRAQPTVSLQLRCLLEAGILSSRREGKKVIYRISNSRVKRILRSVAVK